MLLLLAWVACGPESPPPPPAAPVAAPAPAPPAPEVAPPIAAEDPPPAGRIGGEPILPKPVVIGAIDAAAVDAGIAARRVDIDRCWSSQRAGNPALAGKVLVKFTIARDGHVTSATTKSSSLRDPATEACVNTQVTAARFPALLDGSVAIVHYPFVFPPS